MQLFMLLQEEHTPVPLGIELVQTFGEETVRYDGGSVHGTVAMLSGEASEFQKWLHTFEGIWISNNPMLGAWRVVHIRQDESLAQALKS